VSTTEFIQKHLTRLGAGARGIKNTVDSNTKNPSQFATSKNPGYRLHHFTEITVGTASLERKRGIVHPSFSFSRGVRNLIAYE
jgi:hypothetical protein